MTGDVNGLLRAVLQFRSLIDKKIRRDEKKKFGAIATNNHLSSIPSSTPLAIATTLDKMVKRKLGALEKVEADLYVLISFVLGVWETSCG